MAEKSIYEQERIHNFLEQLARETPPLPAGGCAAALAGAMSAALEQFAAQLTIKKRKNPDSTVGLIEILPRLKDLQKKCVEMMDRDVQEYERVMQALRMPKTTQEEKARREEALREARIEVLGAPMALAESSLEMLRYSHLLIEGGYHVALADAAVAMEMANACFCGGFWIARANLSRISDMEFVERQTKILAAFRGEAERLCGKARDELQKRL